MMVAIFCYLGSFAIAFLGLCHKLSHAHGSYITGNGIFKSHIWIFIYRVEKNPLKHHKRPQNTNTLAKRTPPGIGLKQTDPIAITR